MRFTPTQLGHISKAFYGYKAALVTSERRGLTYWDEKMKNFGKEISWIDLRYLEQEYDLANDFLRNNDLELKIYIPDIQTYLSLEF
ncbi:MAG: hypothetical protein ABW007_03050 [Chitinophagaceae bacterium]